MWTGLEPNSAFSVSKLFSSYSYWTTDKSWNVNEFRKSNLRNFNFWVGLEYASSSDISDVATRQNVISFPLYMVAFRVLISCSLVSKYFLFGVSLKRLYPYTTLLAIFPNTKIRVLVAAVCLYEHSYIIRYYSAGVTPCAICSFYNGVKSVHYMRHALRLHDSSWLIML
jgi:hypothetical protein